MHSFIMHSSERKKICDDEADLVIHAVIFNKNFFILPVKKKRPRFVDNKLIFCYTESKIKEKRSRFTGRMWNYEKEKSTVDQQSLLGY